MSILICIVDCNMRFFMAADRRAIKNGVPSDDYQKIYRLKQKVYFGMTGIAEAGHEILKVTQQNLNLSVSKLIELTDFIFQPNETMLTIMLAGQNEAGDFFIWQKNHEGEVKIAEVSSKKIAISISANDNIALFYNYTVQQLLAGVSAKLAISKTINYASKIDDSISPTYTIIEHVKVNSV